MSQSSEYWQDRCNELECDVADLRERIEILERDLADMTRLAMEYKDANTRLESQLRELLAPRDEAYGRLRAAIGI